MNRTLRDSREVIHLIDKMQGKQSEKEVESPQKLKSELTLHRRISTEPKIESPAPKQTDMS